MGAAVREPARSASITMRPSGRLCVWAFAALLGLAGQAAAQSSTPLEQQRIEQIVHDYLLKHPEVVGEALQAAEAKDKQKQAEATRAAIAAKRKDLLDDPSAPTGGNPKGDVT